MYTYYTPTKLYIEEDLKNIGKIIESAGYHEVLVLSGQKSISKSGILEIVFNSLKENNLTYHYEKGISANPKLSFIEEVLKKDYNYDFILAIGGGSVIDTAKNISVSKAMNCKPWALNNHEIKPTKSLPIGVILTISAAGSEMSDSCVITNEETKEKKGFNSDLIRPKFAIMNPELTYSVSKYQTACGVVDIMMHTLERYFHEESDDIADNLAIAILKTVYENGLIAYNNPTDFKARKNLMLASSFSHNGLTNLGRNKYFRCHQFEHIISGLHDEVAHGAGLAVVFPAYAKYVYKNPLFTPKFKRLAIEVLGIKDAKDDLEYATLGINKLEEYFHKLGMPLRLNDLHISDNDCELMAKLLVKNNKIPDLKPIDYEDAYEIFKLMR